MIHRPTPLAATLVRAALTAGIVLVGFGCESAPPKKISEAVPAPQPVRPPLPAFADAAKRYNQRVQPLDRLTSRANILLTYTDVHGERRVEDPEGTLQIILPSRLAIDLGKAGKKVFWFGCDQERYWWLDLSDSDDRVAAIGRHELFDPARAGDQLGLPLSPLDLIAAIGITPLDPAALSGAVQWSRDGRSLGLVVPFARSAGPASEGSRPGLQRIWVNPDDMVPRSIELFDADRKLVLRAVHEGDERVEITRTGLTRATNARPRIAGRITCHHPASQTEIRITLSNARDGPISDVAFKPDELLRRLGVQRTIDLDAPIDPSPTGGGIF